ncbi:MAG TPA: 2Fe-2S iron-sulfur cluster binding domain-containing protein [Gammaproteobacteria bacterium]|nr:2Fe-2S iron-sulfur cluster binding domain-containing protein [Gammaproteobacteria bacterium]
MSARPEQIVYRIEITDTGESYPCRESQSLLKAMESLGRRGIPVGCRGGGCGVCKIRITSGAVRCRKMSRAHVSEEEERRGVVLACRTSPVSDVRLAVIGKLQKAIRRGRQQGRPRPEKTRHQEE